MARGAVLLETHPAFAEHANPGGHPEVPARLAAVVEGAATAGVADALLNVEARPATRHELERVHPAAYLDAMEGFCRAGGGSLDADTSASRQSWVAATLGAGSGIDAVERLSRGEADAGFTVVRPPGHHARPSQAMGFCLLNNVAVCAADLAAKGERVLIIDIDAHHGNGTQEIFYRRSDVAYVSLHQWPLFPGTGAVTEIGEDDGAGMTVNIPLPPGTTGEVYLRAMDEVISPFAGDFKPTWVLVSAGFDAHRADPLTRMGLSAGDFADLTNRIVELSPPGRRLWFLEGGYDITALGLAAGACIAALAGVSYRPEGATHGGPGAAAVGDAAEVRQRLR